jgi:hypothetical protein
MQEKLDVSLPPGFAIPENKEQLTKALKLIFDLQGDALPAITAALQYENKPKFGASTISNLRFEVVRYDSLSQNGRLRVLYDMQLTFGCEDVIKTHHDQHSYYNFNFNPAMSLLQFESDTPEMPSTVDEF